MAISSDAREGSLEAPTRHPINWKDASFYDEAALFGELERVYDICHGCRRCVSLCHAFPTLFDLIDNSDTLEVDGVAKPDYWKVVEQCYLCDLCYLTKCPYVPPHEWNVDFPHLMLRAKAVKHKNGGNNARDKILTSTDRVGTLAGIPVIAQTVNAVNANPMARKIVEATTGISAKAVLPKFHGRTLRKRFKHGPAQDMEPLKTERTHGRVAIFVTCYGNRNGPGPVEDLISVLRHNDIPVTLVKQEKCCGMPKLELGDLDAVEKLKQYNIPQLAGLADENWDLIAPIPSCVLMYKQELPLLFADDGAVAKVARAFFDPFEYLMLRHRENLLKTDFANRLGSVAYHVPCHQRVQNIGLKTKQILQLVPDTRVEVIERCCGHDGVYAVKREYYDIAAKICRPVADKIRQYDADHYISDCPMAGNHIENEMDIGKAAASPFTLLRRAYGI